MSTAASNPLLNDIRYKEGLKCMNSGMYEEAIELLCSLSEEWLACYPNLALVWTLYCRDNLLWQSFCDGTSGDNRRWSVNNDGSDVRLFTMYYVLLTQRNKVRGRFTNCGTHIFSLRKCPSHQGSQLPPSMLFWFFNQSCIYDRHATHNDLLRTPLISIWMKYLTA